jgi:hypothetical protein
MDVLHAKHTAMHATRLGVLTALAIGLCTLAPPSLLGKGLILFSWHPVLMSAAYLGAMGAGMLVYVGPADEKKVSRDRHRMLQITAALLALLGFAAIALNKVRHGKSIVPASTHAWFGALTLTLTLGQSAVGLSKYAQISARGFASCKFHGDSGRATYTLGAISVALGVASPSMWAGAPSLVLALVALVGLSAVSTLLVSLRFFPRAAAKYDTVNDGESTSAAE